MGQLALSQTMGSTYHRAIATAGANTAHLAEKLFRYKFETAVADVKKFTRGGYYRASSAVSTLIGDTKLREPVKDVGLISPAQVESLRARLRPGDILIERRNWYLSNAFLPGYWPHSALYLGTVEELRTRLDRQAGGDEVIERLRDAWDLQLNVDSTTNLDADGVELGITGWQCIVRCTPKDENAPDYYAETLLTAANLAEAEDIAERAVAPQNAAGEQWEQVDVIRADRVSFEQIEEWLSSGAPGGGAGSSAARSYSRDQAGLLDLRWLTGDPSSNANTKPER